MRCITDLHIALNIVKNLTEYQNLGCSLNQFRRNRFRDRHLSVTEISITLLKFCHVEGLGADSFPPKGVFFMKL